MNKISCPGLDGSNPLHFLAALGMLRLITLDDALARLAWSKNMPHAPVLQTELSAIMCRHVIARHLGIRGRAALLTRRHRLLGAQEEAQRELEKCENGKAGKKAAREIKETIRGRRERIRRIDLAIKTNGDAGVVRCHPFAGAADCIHQVPQGEFRIIATRAQPPLWQHLLPGLAADRSRRYKKDEMGLSRTRFSFSNGGSGKALLKDFRSSLSKIRLGDSKTSLLGFSTDAEEVTGLMWEPAEQRNYALRWLNPTDDATRSVPILNALAFVGLSFFPVLPATPSDRTAGFDGEEDSFCWAVWTDSLNVEVVQSVLASEFVQSATGSEAQARGIVARFQAEVITADKRNYFAPLPSGMRCTMDAVIDEQDRLTIDHLHQYAYCPRRMHLMYVDGRWDNNAFTEEGREAHGRVDSRDHVLPEPKAAGESVPEGDPAPTITRSVMLDSPTLGLVGKPDLVEAEGGVAVPVDTKRGSPPDNPQQSYEPERVQLMAQGLLLREHGYLCSRGFLYFAEARRRVEVLFSPELEAHTRFLIHEAQVCMRRQEPPAPLDDSPKCTGCSLSAICLPDETNLLNARNQTEPADVRRLYPSRDDALPLYVQDQGSRIGKEGERLAVRRGGGETEKFLLRDVSQVVLCGNVAMTPQTLHHLCENGISVVHLSTGGWFYGVTHGHGLRNAYDRAAQFAAAADSGRCLAFAKAVVEGKARNQRTLLRRNAGAEVGDALDAMAGVIDRIGAVTDCESLLGVEGAIAARYFGSWTKMLKTAALGAAFDISGRNRRPPKDPINAMLSYGYALLVKECTVALMAEGLDPWWGLYHRPRHGRPALALDLMEEFRPLVVDSAVLTAVNTGMVGAKDFETGVSGCLMKPAGRKALIQAYEQRLDQLVTHPVFDYRCSWRSIIRVQARLLARWLRGDVPEYVGMTTR